MATRLLLAWSGGKDSALALHTLRQDPAYAVAALLTTVTSEYDRVSIHGVRRELLHQQARSAGVRLREVVIAPRTSNEAYEAAMLAGIAAEGNEARPVDAVAFGDLFLEDIRAYRERLVARAGVGAVFPVWGRDTARLARALVALGFRAIVVCVDRTQLDPSFAGREYDEAFLDDLPPSVDPCGERGEFHTFVYAGPIFAAPIPVARGETVVRDERFVYCDLMVPRLVPRTSPPVAPPCRR